MAAATQLEAKCWGVLFSSEISDLNPPDTRNCGRINSMNGIIWVDDRGMVKCFAIVQFPDPVASETVKSCLWRCLRPDEIWVLDRNDDFWNPSKNLIYNHDVKKKKVYEF